MANQVVSSASTSNIGKLIAEYEAAYKEWAETAEKDLEIQSLIAAYYQAWETSGDSAGDNATKHQTSHAAEAERQHYQDQLERLIQIKVVKQTAKEEARKLLQVTQAQTGDVEKAALKAWETFERLQVDTAKKALSRNNEPYDELILQDILAKVKTKLETWREEKFTSVRARYRKERLQVQLEKQMLIAGNLDRTLPFEEYRTNLRNYQNKLQDKERHTNALFDKQKVTVNELAHMREKLEYLHSLGLQLQDRVREAEQTTGLKKEELHQSNLRRVVIKKQNMSLKKRAGLLTKPALLDDMAVKIKRRNDLLKQVTKAKEKYQKYAPNVTENDLWMIKRNAFPLLPETFNDPGTILQITEYADKKDRLDSEKVTELKVVLDPCANRRHWIQK